MTSDFEPDVELELLAVPASAGVARHVIAGLLPPDVEPLQREQLLVAVSEAVTNAVLHGHHDGSVGTVTLAGRRVESTLELRVTDPGRGLLPSQDARGLGIGLSIVAAAADGIEVRGDELRIRFELRR